MKLADFDFERLNFKYDQKTKSVRMNRGYLGEFLRANGVMSLPGAQDLLDLLAGLYLLRRNHGKDALPHLDAFLRDNNMEIKVHDPSTITPGRRLMDNRMDDLLLRARTKARESESPDLFWRWLDDELVPIAEDAASAGEQEAYNQRLGEILQLAKDAGVARHH